MTASGTRQTDGTRAGWSLGVGLSGYLHPLPNMNSTGTSIGPPVSPSPSSPRRTSSRTARRTSSGSVVYSAPIAPAPRSKCSK